MRDPQHSKTLLTQTTLDLNKPLWRYLLMT